MASDTPTAPTIKRVLCATDLSQAADAALREADEISRARGARLEVVLVLPEPLVPHPVLAPAAGVAYAVLPGVDRRTLEALEQRLVAVTGERRKDVEITVEHGLPYAMIARRAKETHADLLVVGARGTSGLERLLLGSVSERLVRYAPCSVLVARLGPETRDVLAGVDFSEASRQAAALAADEAGRRGGRLILLHSLGLSALVVAPVVAGPAAVPAPIPLPDQRRDELKRAARERLEQMLRGLGATGEAIVAEGDPAEDLRDAAQRLRAQLVAVGTIGRTALERMLVGSVALDVVGTAPCSVVVVR